MRVLLALGVVGMLIGVISIILGGVAKFSDGVLWTNTASAYLRFGEAAFLWAISAGILALLNSIIRSKGGL